MLKLFEQLGPIDSLIQKGRSLRAEGKDTEALAVYLEAWRIAEEEESDALRVASSHMVGVCEPDPARKLKWNLASLRAAEALDEETAKDCFPTIHANIGYSYLALGRRADALRHYEMARDLAADLTGPYGDQIRNGIAGMLEELG